MVSENANLCLQQTQSNVLAHKTLEHYKRNKNYLLLFYTLAIKPQLVIKWGKMRVIQKTRQVRNRPN